MNLEDLFTDCRHFEGDRPCLAHKREGALCPTCHHYDPVHKKLLIVKLAAAGDVLRTTSILPGLKRQHPHVEITWIAEAGAVPLLERHPLIDRVLSFRGSTPVELLVEEFDFVLNPDASSDACALAMAARARVRKGFGLDRLGRPVPLHPEAVTWYRMGLLDEEKRANTRSYPAILLDMFGIEGEPSPPQLHLTDAELDFGRRFVESQGLAGSAPIVGLNTGAGSRWQYKKWTLEGYSRLVEILLAEGVSIVLLGGPEERERNRSLQEMSRGRLVDAGTENSLRQFAAIVDRLDLMVTGDTLAMHIAMARGVPVVALFGPTSTAEIDLFGRGAKITSDLDCLCCYLQRCDKDPNCMNSIAADQVYAAVRSTLSVGRAPAR